MSDRPWNDEEEIVQTPGPLTSSRYTPFQQEFLRYLGISVLVFIVGCAGEIFILTG